MSGNADPMKGEEYKAISCYSIRTGFAALVEELGKPAFVRVWYGNSDVSRQYREAVAGFPCTSKRHHCKRARKD